MARVRHNVISIDSTPYDGDDDIVRPIEHRAAPSPKPLTLTLVTAADGSGTHLEVAAGERQVRSSELPLDAKGLELIEVADRAMHVKFGAG